ncbi:protein IQ-DOMAIN 1-like [Salvia splendens]|uniref:protein IQ-DOMAIN 1-like n=1 Tax=Salvia splendens TaxID=180675 RepID=UPI001C25ECDE|nr:protein IQ-DOMAIN 1-like [Salvia splendens]
MAKGNLFSSVKKALGLRSKRSSKSQKILLVNEMPSVSDLPNPEPFEAIPEVVPLPTVARVSGKHQEEVAALKIQTAFGGYLDSRYSHAYMLALIWLCWFVPDLWIYYQCLIGYTWAGYYVPDFQARRALRALRGLVRLKSLVDGSASERQTSSTLKCLQTLSRLQSQIQNKKNQNMAEEWDDSPQTKEETEASLLQKYEAAMRRERALAYSYTHQQTWKKSAKLNNLLFMDPTNPHWGSTGTAAGEITKSFARHQLNSENPSPAATQKLSHSHQATALPSPRAVSSLAARKLRNASPKVSMMSQEDDSRSVFSVQSERKEEA